MFRGIYVACEIETSPELAFDSVQVVQDLHDASEIADEEFIGEVGVIGNGNSRVGFGWGATDKQNPCFVRICIYT